MGQSTARGTTNGKHCASIAFACSSKPQAMWSSIARQI